MRKEREEVFTLQMTEKCGQTANSAKVARFEVLAAVLLNI
jgi:rRNA maturation protein Nop10